VREAATDDTNIIFGATIDDRLTGQLWITVVATGLGSPRRRGFPSATSSAGCGPGSARGRDDVLEPPSFLRG
jgi:cell division GTPase FtsZ